ncbi:MAG: alpha/beta hydrolase [Pseudomonadota bacterium]
MTAERITLKLDDGQMAGWRWARAGAPRLLFAHANGFNAYTYRQMFDALSAMRDVEIIAIDLRGHGRTTLPADPATMTGWQVYADDLTKVIDQLGDPPLTLAGHSLGGASLILAAARLDAPLNVLAIDPVLLPAVVYAIARSPLHPIMRERLSLVRQARSRRDRWSSREAVLSAYSAKSMFSVWADKVLEDYLQDGLIESESGVRLACSPDWEAANFGEQTHHMWRAVETVGSRLHVLKAGRGSTVMRPGKLRRSGALLDIWPQDGHLLAMEKPEAAARWISSKLDTLDAPPA